MFDLFFYFFCWQEWSFQKILIKKYQFSLFWKPLKMFSAITLYIYKYIGKGYIVTEISWLVWLYCYELYRVLPLLLFFLFLQRFHTWNVVMQQRLVLEKKNEVPQNFRRLLSSRLRRLVAQEKLEKVIGFDSFQLEFSVKIFHKDILCAIWKTKLFEYVNAIFFMHYCFLATIVSCLYIELHAD